MKPKIQLAIDALTIEPYENILSDIVEYVDIIEAGTLLCLSEGMNVVKKLKEKFTNKDILADIRIIKAGSVLSKLAFDNNADIVTIVSDCDEETIKAVFDKAKEYNKEIQVEITNEIDDDKIELLKKYNINQIVIHRGSELNSKNEDNFEDEFFNKLDKLTKLGFNVSVTGGITKDDIHIFKNYKIYSFIMGRAILKAKEPLEEIKGIKNAIDNNF